MYWLLKSEPGAWSWDDQIREGTTRWDGVRNYQARNNMQSMKVGDACFFYHSSIPKPAVVGIVKVISPYEPDPDDPRFGDVHVEVVEPIPHPVTLMWIKEHPRLQDIPLIKQSRLSVMPLTDTQWNIIHQRGFNR